MELWGYKTVALLDVWSIEHFATGMNLFFLSSGWHRWLRGLNKAVPDTLSLFGWVLTVCFAWETLEHYLETGLAGNAVTFWFQGVEHWSNRLIADPLLIFAGSWLAMHHRWLNWPSKIFSGAWLLVHIFLFPHSMYLQHFTPTIPL